MRHPVRILTLAICLSLAPRALAAPADAATMSEMGDAAVAPAAPVVVSVLVPQTPGVLAETAIAAVKTSNWRHLAAVVLIGLTLLIKKLGSKIKFLKFLDTDRGGAALVVFNGVAGTLAALLLSDAAITTQALVDGVTLGLESAGGFTVVKRIIWPKDTTPTPPPPA